VHRRSTIEALAEGFIEALRSLIAHCLSPQAGGYTPSDFPLAKVDQQRLDRMVGEGRQIEDVYPLSPTQQGMLFYSLYAPRSGVYVQQMSFVVHGNLNVLIFEQAWQRVIDRHPILRTAFIWEDLDEPLQVVRHKARLPLERHDWRGLSPTEQEERLESFLQADRSRGFELSKASLMRLILIQLAEDTCQFIWSLHHLLLDGWSLPLILKEILAFYEAFCRGQDLRLERPRPYRDYIAWLRQQDISKAEVFWRQTLKGFTAPTPLGLGRVSGSLPGQEARHKEQELRLSVAVTATLRSLVRQHNLTLNTLVQGVWALLLSHYSGEEDVVFGATISGRPAALAGVESMVGLFINTLPVRVRVSPEAMLLSWLKELQSQMVELRQYEYSSLVQIQGWSEVPRGLPLFETIVVFANYPTDVSPWEQGEKDRGFEIGEVRGIEQTNYPLTVTAIPGSELLLQVNYNCHHFDATTVSRILGHFEVLLRNIVTQRDARLNDLEEILAQAERQQRIIERQERKEANLQRLKKIRRKAISEPQLR